MENKAEELSNRLFQYSLMVIEVCKDLNYNYISRHIGNQLLRSATSSGANYEEARGSETKNDFIYKLHLVFKELRESLYWLKLVHNSKLLNRTIEKEITESEELIKIIGKSLLTAKINVNNKIERKVR